MTLTGVGGVGKTRLALQLAADVLETFSDGVWLVELAALTDPALVPQTVAAAVGVQENAHQPLLATLREALASRALLLVLDNCEHVVDACARLAVDLLHTCPDVRVLATSREVLSAPGEQVWRVPTLSLPETESVEADEVMRAEAAAFSWSGPQPPARTLLSRTRTRRHWPRSAAG